MNGFPDIDAIEDEYPLSPLQQGMLFHTLRDSRSGIDIEQLVLTLCEALDIGAFQDAWRLVAQRHAVLRSRFRWSGVDEPRQEVRATIELPWTEQDWRGIPCADQQRHFAEFLKQDRHTGIDPACAPMWRLTFLYCGEHLARLVWTFHHALLDGRSITSVVREVFAHYDSVRSGQSPPLADAEHPFREYIDWLQRQNVSAAEPYWRKALEGFIEPTPLVLASRGDETGFGECDAAISPETSAAITSFALEHDLTLNTLILGAWALLLSRYSERADVVFGVTRSCRRTTIPGAHAVVGLLINTLPLRIGIDSNTSLLPWLSEIRAKWTSMREYEHTPLACVQAWSDVPAGTPLFESFVMFEKEPLNATLQRAGGAWAKRETQIFGLPNYPFSLAAYGGEEIQLSLTFDTHRMDESAAVRMLGHLQSLLEGMASNPLAKLGDLAILTAAERRQALFEWNQTATQFAAQGTLSELFEAQVDRTPDAIAVESADGCLTYRTLNQRANKLAWDLRQRGIGPDALVAVCAERSLEMVVGLLAVLKAGGAYVPIDPNHPRDRVAFVLRDAGVRLMLVQDRTLEALPDLSAFEVVSLSGEWISSENDANLASIVDAANLAYVLYTSGSTGRPNGVLVPHAAIVNLVLWMQWAFPLDGRDCVLQHTEITFDTSVWEIFGTLIAGARLLMAPCGPKDPVGLSKMIAEHGVTAIDVVPSLLRALLDTSEFRQCSGLRHVFCGGENMSEDIPPKFFSALNAELHNLYGPTETAIQSLYYSIPRGRVRGAIPIGRPAPNVQAYVLDQRRQPMPIGVSGELYIAGRQLARGYHNRLEQNAERFVPNPFVETAGERLFRTGDRVFRVPSGEIVFLGRMDHQVKLRGIRIELGEIEHALQEHPLVAEAVVLLRESVSGDKVLVAYMAAVGGERAPVNELRARLRQQLPSHMMPATFVTLDALPLTSNGKLDRKALLHLDAPNPDEPVLHRELRTISEVKMATIWREVLGLTSIGADDSFFDLGGHSLLAIRLISAVNERLGVTLGIPDLYAHSTLKQFAALIDAKPALRRREPSVVVLKPGSGALPVYFVDVSPRTFQQAQLMETRPIFGIDRPWPKVWFDAALGNENSKLPSIDDMLPPYVTELCAHAGLGPCVLAGHSAMGLVAFELAHQFQLRGGRAPFVLLFDTIAQRPAGVRVILNRLRRDLEKNNSLPATARLQLSIDLTLDIIREKATNRAKTWARLFSKPRNEDLGPPTYITDEEGVVQPWGLVNCVYDAIEKSFRPRQLQSRGLLFTASHGDKNWRDVDPSLGWRDLFSEGFEVIELEGDHLSIFGPEQPGPNLKRAINEALARLSANKLE